MVPFGLRRAVVMFMLMIDLELPYAAELDDLLKIVVRFQPFLRLYCFIGRVHKEHRSSCKPDGEMLLNITGTILTFNSLD